ncbi:MAG TPA: hypothetical protein VGB70_01815 [Allosphingosinicella sp.]|jgi:hypothetical protein
MRPILLLAPLVLVACGNPVRDDHYANQAAPTADAPPTVPVTQDVPVRVGELGPNFAACATAGTTRHLKPGQNLPVRAAPFETAGEAGAIPAGARFYVCARSHDQKWLGVVYDESGQLGERCGVSTPVTRRSNYAGPCRSGWVASAFVRFIAGIEQPPEANQPAAEGNTAG